ncbi:TetR/AcrR family transcriptional regulator [Paenibacillus wynnii]|uniref:TetR/AcrR family transcriptional regulator n=1 Tax=Paenibacillus wynnii TaxID=268407 RepID=UPI002792E70E|nr:TetR/AcrR family transcriptional regulator [Paenibacillus wynnii]MDQ0194342.1 AcrR family transcriptional regulator [Paenibacillus wynnii]
MSTGNNIEASSNKDTKQSILNATVELIREQGFSCTSLRKIAARADINLALVNYHYGSKENLLSDAVRVLISTFDDAFSALDDNSLPPKERLKTFFMRYIEKLKEHPGLARQMLDETPHIMASQDEYMRYCKMMRMQKITSALQEITKEQDEDMLMTMLMQLYGAIVFPVIMTSSIPEGQKFCVPMLNLPSIDVQIDGLFEHYFHKYN